VTVTRSNVTRVPLFSMPPPSMPAVFFLTVVSLTVTSPWLSSMNPPPVSVALLFSKVEPVIESSPFSVYRPPPLAMFAPAGLASSPGVGTPASLPVNNESVTLI
jgi:hypothetical protein